MDKLTKKEQILFDSEALMTKWNGYMRSNKVLPRLNAFASYLDILQTRFTELRGVVRSDMTGRFDDVNLVWDKINIAIEDARIKLLMDKTTQKAGEYALKTLNSEWVEQDRRRELQVKEQELDFRKEQANKDDIKSNAVIDFFRAKFLEIEENKPETITIKDTKEILEDE